MTDYIVQIIETPTNVEIIQTPGGPILTDTIINVVGVGSQGPTGPQGPAGSSGSGTTNYTSKNDDYYTSFSIDDFVAVDASGGNVNIYLPLSSSPNAGQVITVKKIDSSSNEVLVTTLSGQDIDGLGITFPISYLNDTYGFLSTSTGFKIL